MTWEQFIPLIIRYGVEGAYSIWKVMQEHDRPTLEAWKALIDLGLKPYDLYILEARWRAQASGQTSS